MAGARGAGTDTDHTEGRVAAGARVHSSYAGTDAGLDGEAGDVEIGIGRSGFAFGAEGRSGQAGVAVAVAGFAGEGGCVVGRVWTGRIAV